MEKDETKIYAVCGVTVSKKNWTKHEICAKLVTSFG